MLLDSLRQVIRKLLRQCVTWQTVQGKPYQTPDLPPLIKEKTQSAQCFELTGVNFTGALHVGNKGNKNKVYMYVSLHVR